MKRKASSKKSLPNRTIRRGVILFLPPWVKNPLSFFVWVLWAIHRFNFPTMVLEMFIASLIGWILGQGVIFAILCFSLIETLYISVAVHETFHMAYARFIGGMKVIEGISIIPSSLEVRTNFCSDNKIPPEDLCVITFAGPVFPLLIVLAASILLFYTKMPTWTYLHLAVFASINVLSLLPSSGSDGWKVRQFLKNKPEMFSVLISAIFCFLAPQLAKRRPEHHE